MKIKIITAIHNREPLTRAFCVAMKRVKETFGIETKAVITSHDRVILLLEEFGMPYIEYPNNPLGNKFNQVVYSLKEDDFTHLMVLGSDDIPSDAFMEEILQQKDFDVAAPHDLWFWGMNPKRDGFRTFGFWTGRPGHPMGVGRLISRKAVKKLGWKLWDDDRNAGLDGSMIIRLRKYFQDCKFNTFSTKEKFVVDIKYGPNISSLTPTLRNTIFSDPEEIYNHLPKEECDYLLKLYNER